MSEPTDSTTHFGYKDVPLADKQTLVNEVFHSVARRYDLMNDLMSGGLAPRLEGRDDHALNPPRDGAPFELLDVAGRHRRHRPSAPPMPAGPNFQATVCDINTDMLAVGRERAEARHLDHRVTFIEGQRRDVAVRRQ